MTRMVAPTLYYLSKEREYPSVGTAMLRAGQLSPFPVAKPEDPNE